MAFIILWDVKFGGRCFGEIIPGFVQLPVPSAICETEQFNGWSRERVYTIWPEALPIIPRSPGDMLFNDCEHIGLNLKFFGSNLRSYSPMITAPASQQSSEYPPSQNPQGIVWNLKRFGRYLGNHLWLFPISWVFAAVFGFGLSKIKARGFFN